MKNEDLIVLTVLPLERASQLKEILLDNDIEVELDPIRSIQPLFIPRVNVRISVLYMDKLLAFLDLNSKVKDDYSITLEPPLVTTDEVLLPVDFSEYTWKACEFAFDYCYKYGGKIVFLHSYLIPQVPYVSPETDASYLNSADYISTQQRIEEAEKQVSEFKSQVEGAIRDCNMKPVDYRFVLREGVAEDEIRLWSKKHKPQLIVMGTRGCDEKENDLLGSVTAEVVDVSTTPVLAIPKYGSFIKIDQMDKLAFLTDFDERDLYSYDNLMHLDGFNEKQIVFFVLKEKNNLEGESVTMKLKERYPDVKIDFKILDEEELLNDINSLITELSVDVLVVPTHKRNIFSRLFNPSIAQKIVFHSDTPILAIRDEY